MSNHNGATPQDEAAQPALPTVNQMTASDDPIARLNKLLNGSPVLSAKQAKKQAAQQTEAATATSKPAIATASDFDQIEGKRPFARTVKPKIVLGAVIALCAILPLSAVFSFMRGDQSPQQTASSDLSDPDAMTEEMSPEMAELIEENEQLKAQQAFIDQQIDIEAIDAKGQAKQAQAAANQVQATPPRSTATPARPATASPATVRATPTPTRRTVTTAASTTRTATPASAARPVQREGPPVDPYARREQLQALGVYGSPPPTTAASYVELASNPFEVNSGYGYIQAISMEPAVADPAFTIQPDKDKTPQAETETPIEDSEYQEDAAVVLNQRLQEESPKTLEQPDPAQPTAIMPGTSVDAEIAYGFQWREGLAVPDILLETTEDIMAGDVVALPAGTQMLAQAIVDPASGVTDLNIIAFFGNSDIRIPRNSVIIHETDGSPLVAKSSGGPSTSGPNFGGLIADAFSNSLSNIIDSDDSLAVDIGGGLAEAVIENQRDRAELSASQRAARAAAQPVTWTLEPGRVRITFNNLVPLTASSR